MYLNPFPGVEAPEKEDPPARRLGGLALVRAAEARGMLTGMESGTTNFGEHLMLDGYGGSPEKLSDKDLVFSCLNDLPNRLGMHKLSEPVVFFAPGNAIKDPGGWSGFVVIEESHISIHTFPGRRFVSIDVYTCKSGMDTKFISDYFKKVFLLEDIEQNFVKRGTRYPLQNIV